MKIELTINKHVIYILLILLLIVTFTIAQNNLDFGHTYSELILRNSQGKGLITASDIQSAEEEDGKTYLKLNVLRAKSAENALAARCELTIMECANTPVNNLCRQGYYQVPGWFSFSGSAKDNSLQCNSGGKIALCCKSN